MQDQQIDQLFNNLKQDKTQMVLAEQAENALFTNDEAKKNTFQTINAFLDDYLINGRHQPIEQWLKFRFDQYPDIWENEQEKIETANTIIHTIERLTVNQVELEKHLNKRKTIENFYQNKIDILAEEYQLNSTELAQEVDNALSDANRNYFGFLTGQEISLPMEDEALNQKTIKRAKLNAQLNLMGWGLKSVGSRLVNSFLGKKNLSHGEELQKIIRSAVDTAENKGVQIAVSGGVVVSAKKGWIKDAFAGLDKLEKVVGKAGSVLSRVQDLTLSVANGWDDIRLFDRVERGVLKAADVAAEKAKFVVAQTITNLEQKADLFLRKNGAKLGSKIGATVGSLAGPVGTTIGSVVGGFLGEKAGGWLSEKVVKPVAETAKKVADKVIDTVKDTAKSFVSSVSSAAESVVSSIVSGIRSLLSW
ncbi:glycine zipper domain-containing protein [Haemophilus haemolyticus]|uniref:glycine zipper domain-containing protein n=1 Tax=Haemophilus haemolyticus TaxID=726 RepID=UPI000E58F96F|nr:glycine zipper domain-containing protein [Haemophilus haemolyticus]